MFLILWRYLSMEYHVLVRRTVWLWFMNLFYISGTLKTIFFLIWMYKFLRFLKKCAYRLHTRVSTGRDVPLSLCPGTKKFSCHGVLLSRNKGRSKCPGTNSSVPARPGTKRFKNFQKKDQISRFRTSFLCFRISFPVLERPFLYSERPFLFYNIVFLF